MGSCRRAGDTLTSSSDSQIRPLISLVRAGDQDAAEVVFDRYAQQLARLAEKHLNHRLARRVEGDDVVQSVFRTFFQRVERGEFQIRSRDQLWKLLVTITIRKTQMQARRHGAEKRDVRLETGDPVALMSAIDREPGPEEARILDEEIDRVLLGMPSGQQELYRRLLELKLAGHSNDEIAGELGIVRRTVERMLNRLEERFDASG
tara:strand:+ start:58986 stop:59600 length:615 start_codon:yes stop_codon:yes gene_type:complete